MEDTALTMAFYSPPPSRAQRGFIGFVIRCSGKPAPLLVQFSGNYVPCSRRQGKSSSLRFGVNGMALARTAPPSAKSADFPCYGVDNRENRRAGPPLFPEV
jgi:hypothetical protein